MINSFKPDNEKPIFMQFAEQLEDSILRGIFKEETQIPSTTEVSVTLKINPATANRGVNLLVDEGIIYKRRGVGMYVASGAVSRIKAKRQKAFYSSYIVPLLKESANLGIEQDEIINMIRRGNG
ncbi:MAG: GntR family transcriptional regulator [Dehalococcoidales bacterium]|nr:GntR family transcriptional regulator [Dehalococcoidales bacterium]